MWQMASARLGLVLAGLALACGAEPDGAHPSAEPQAAWKNAIPRPLEAQVAEEAYTLGADTRISVPSGDAELERSAELLATVLRRSTGWEVPVVEGDPSAAIRLATTSALPELGEEGYELGVDASGVSIRAPGPAGAFYATQTLRQLLPARVEQPTLQPGRLRLATGVIRDRPRYAWRGLMVDVARHFFTIDELRRYVDVMAHYKLNRLHLHLTDDQGWRIQIDAWPALTQIGGSSEVGGGPGGFYTKVELAELTAYAAERQVVVVPEIDMPGHTRAALASVPELNCDGKAPSPYTGTSVGISSLCIGLPVTEQFVSDVIAEVAASTPGPWLHVGGDEAEQTSEPDYVAFMTMVQQKVAANGKALVGWEEVARSGAGSGSFVQHWRQAELAALAAANGASVILSPASRAYLDMKYDLQTPAGKGTFWAGLVDVETAYDWNPGDFIVSLPQSRIAGVEAAVWTETLSTAADLDVMVFPRLLGHAELAWSPWEGHDVDAYLERLGAHGPRLRALGIAYFPAPNVPWVE